MFLPTALFVVSTQTDRLSVYYDGAGTAGPLTAAVLYGIQLQIIAQVTEQRLVLFGALHLAVYCKLKNFSHYPSPHPSLFRSYGNSNFTYFLKPPQAANLRVRGGLQIFKTQLYKFRLRHE